jgi:hypothetical protein
MYPTASEMSQSPMLIPVVILRKAKQATVAVKGGGDEPKKIDKLRHFTNVIAQNIPNPDVNQGSWSQVIDLIGAPTGNRTPVSAVKGRRPNR